MNRSLHSLWQTFAHRFSFAAANHGAKRALTLQAKALWRIEPEEPSAVAIRCVQGTVWITVTGEPEDIILQPGETWARPSGGLTVIEALTDSVLQVVDIPASPAGIHRREVTPEKEYPFSVNRALEARV